MYNKEVECRRVILKKSIRKRGVKMRKALNIGLLIYAVLAFGAMFTRDAGIFSNVMTWLVQVGLAFSLKELVLMES